MSQPVSGHDVARELRRRLPEAGALKLQKLLYYCQGWSLAWNGGPLFTERVEAWDQGPVVAAVWRDERYSHEPPPAAELTPEQLRVVDYVVWRYGDLSGQELADQSHEEAPWRELAGADGQLLHHNAEITPEALRRWFTADAEFQALQAEVERLRARRDVFAFEGDPVPPAMLAATERVLGDQARS